MKTSSSIQHRLAIALLCFLVPRVDAQAPAGLSIQTYAGLTITGAVGTVYSVQYTTNLTYSNDWREAAVVQLPTSPYLWIDTTAAATLRRVYRVATNPTNMVWISPGTFTMGSVTQLVAHYSMYPGYVLSEGPQTRVTISRGFFMGKYEVTQAEFLAVMGYNRSSFTGDLNRPVGGVFWEETLGYCAALTARGQSEGRLPPGWKYRLPTEAEWEYACRAGTTTAFYYGDGLYAHMANFSWNLTYPPCGGDKGSFDGHFSWCYELDTGVPMMTLPVGSFAPNAWGLFDMHGNEAEWVQDFWSPNLPGGSVTDPQGPSSGSDHVFRGGNYGSFGDGCRSAYRYHTSPDGTTGFRVVLAPTQP